MTHIEQRDKLMAVANRALTIARSYVSNDAASEIRRALAPTIEAIEADMASEDSCETCGGKGIIGEDDPCPYCALWVAAGTSE